MPGTPDPRPIRPNEVAKERQSLDFYTSHLQGLLSVLPTSAEEDAALLAGPRVLAPRVAAAVRSRLEYKLLIAEGLVSMQAYGAYLENSVQVAGSLWGR